MKLGFFGGSFNPPTIAHYNLIKQAKNEYNFDEVYFVPVNDYYNKSNLITMQKRIEMLNIVCKNQKGIKVLDIEKDINHKLSASQILEIITQNFSNDEIVFFMGEDNFLKMPTWENYRKLKSYKYIIFQRNDNTILDIRKKNIIYMKNSENLKISSSLIRNKISKNESISNLVFPEIEQYILKNNLYK